MKQGKGFKVAAGEGRIHGQRQPITRINPKNVRRNIHGQLVTVAISSFVFTA